MTRGFQGLLGIFASPDRARRTGGSLCGLDLTVRVSWTSGSIDSSQQASGRELGIVQVSLGCLASRVSKPARPVHSDTPLQAGERKDDSQTCYHLYNP